MLYIVKNYLPSGVEYFRENTGEIAAWTNEGIETYGLGKDSESAREDLLHSLRDIANFYVEDFEEWITHNPKELPYILRVLMSTDEELRQWRDICLNTAN